MASASVVKGSLVFLLTVLSVSSALEFDVGDEGGWAVPSAEDKMVYNHWASKNRFKVGDTVRFRYKKDSVMVVTEEEYEHCKSVHPDFFSNTGDTTYELGHSGTFYFISGVAGHCERGQKIIVRVLADSDAPGGSPSGNQTSDTTPSGSSSSRRLRSQNGADLFGVLIGAVFALIL